MISCVSIKIMWNHCASIKLSNLQTINAQSSLVRPQLPGLQRLRQVGLGFPDIRSCLSKAMQHSICTILWCILEAWPTSCYDGQITKDPKRARSLRLSDWQRSKARVVTCCEWTHHSTYDPYRSLHISLVISCDPWIFIPWNSIAALGPLQPPPRSSQGSVQPGPDEPDSWILLEITWNYWYFNLWIYEYKLLVDSSRYVYIILIFIYIYIL